jgi:bifunctional DNA-binding transcriptional regulator/antitoxin component of YhaV-PrlF toxin-antitoxin module
MTTYTRKLVRTGAYSYTLTIPKEIVEHYGWREGQKLTLTNKGRGVVELKDWKRS